MFLSFSDHFWTAPLLTQTVFAPNRFFDQTVVCPNLCEPSLTPNKPRPVGLLFGTICCSCLVFWAMDLLARDPPLPKTLLLMCCGAWCVACGVCSRFSWVSPTLPPPDPPLPTLPQPDRPKFRSFFSLSRPHFRSFFVSLWGLVEILVVFEAPGSSNVHVWAHGLSCETPAAFCKMSRTILHFFLPSLLLRLPKKSMTNYRKFCLYPEKRPRTHRSSTGRRLSPPSGPTPLGPHFLLVVVCAVCAAPDSAACCCFSCCLCSCCGLLPLLLLLLVLVTAVCTIAAVFFCCCCFCLLLLLGRRPSNPLLHLAVFDLPKCP